MKLLILAALAATMYAQTADTAVQRSSEPTIKTPAIAAAAPGLSPEQKLAVSAADNARLRAEMNFSAYIRQLEAGAEFQRLKTENDKANATFAKIATDILTKAGCPECQLDTQTLTLQRPELAKVEDKKKETQK